MRDSESSLLDLLGGSYKDQTLDYVEYVSVTAYKSA